MALFMFDEHLTEDKSADHQPGMTSCHRDEKDDQSLSAEFTVNRTAIGVDIRSHARTPPINIASTLPIRTLPTSNPAPLPLPEEKLDIDKVRSKAARKKKKKRGMKPAPPADHVVRGFQTPLASGGEESDISALSTPRLLPRMSAYSSVTSSPALPPASGCGGISALKLKLEALSSLSPLDKARDARYVPSSNASVISGAASDSDKTEMDTYEIPLENEFVSPDVPSKGIMADLDSGLKSRSISRKMTASDFDPITCLGTGTYGTVLLVKQRATGRLYAQKQFRKASLIVHKKLVEQTKTERVILENVNRHPFVVKLFYAFQDHEKLYLILEYAQGGELFHHLSNSRMFSEDVASFYMAEMVLALEHLHRNIGVVYRDLKPENCLLDAEGHLLLTDFGLSKVAVDSEDAPCRSILGTVDYMAPEVIRGDEYGMAVDWWSLGAVGVDLLTGSPPFQANNHAKTQEKILKQKLALPYFLSPDAKDLLTRLLRKEPKKRLGSNMPKDMQTIKAHRFFRKIDWKKLANRECEPPIQPLVTDPELAENFSREFTDMALSPVATSGKSGIFGNEEPMTVDGENPFGGFSFVASESLLEVGLLSGGW